MVRRSAFKASVGRFVCRMVDASHCPVRRSTGLRARPSGIPHAFVRRSTKVL